MRQHHEGRQCRRDWVTRESLQVGYFYENTAWGEVCSSNIPRHNDIPQHNTASLFQLFNIKTFELWEILTNFHYPLTLTALTTTQWLVILCGLALITWDTLSLFNLFAIFCAKEHVISLYMILLLLYYDIFHSHFQSLRVMGISGKQGWGQYFWYRTFLSICESVPCSVQYYAVLGGQHTTVCSVVWWATC